MESVRVIDTHTAGEPTRVVIAGGPELGSDSLADRCTRFRQLHDSFRSAIVNEPRGSDVLVAALLVPPVDRTCATGVIFFNNVSTLGMCGHGTMGVMVALAHLGRVQAGSIRIETPVGVVSCEFDGRSCVAVTNVVSYRSARDVMVDVAGIGPVTGDVAWGGNWFFLTRLSPPLQNTIDFAAPSPPGFAGGEGRVRGEDTPSCVSSLHLPGPIPPLPNPLPPQSRREKESVSRQLTIANVAALTEDCWRIRRALTANGITGADGAEIDHIELFGPPHDSANHARNFVLCPGGAYDRSPCGTGTSAKLACLAADGRLQPGEFWRQESVIGSVFVGSYEPAGAHTIPRIAGTAYVTAEATLLFDPHDPFRAGIRL